MVIAVKVLCTSLLNFKAFEEKKIIIPNTCKSSLEPISYLIWQKPLAKLVGSSLVKLPTVVLF